MPLEIRELEIKATLTDTASGKPGTDNSHPNFDREALIEECLQRMQQLLKDQKEF